MNELVSPKRSVSLTNFVAGGSFFSLFPVVEVLVLFNFLKLEKMSRSTKKEE
jgi:hypothetical protein